jgi:hypothetical protein
MRRPFDGVSFAQQGHGTDICQDILRLGEGWHALENDDGTPFRWIGNEAHALLASSGVPYLLRIDVEPGPSAPALPFRLELFDGEGRYRSDWIRGRTLVRSVIAPGEPGMRSIRLKVGGGGKPVPRDERILNARVYEFCALPAPPEVVPIWHGIFAGRGWYGLRDEPPHVFRSMNREAHLHLMEPLRTLEMDLEPFDAPHEPRRLDVYLEPGRMHRSYLITARTRIAIDLPELPAYPARMILRCERKAVPKIPDARAENFRFFCVAAPWERGELLRRLAFAIPYTPPLPDAAVPPGASR